MVRKSGKRKKAIRLFVVNARISSRKRKKGVKFSPFTLKKGGRVAAFVVVLGGCGWGGYEVGHYLFTDSRFAVKKIMVVGNERLSEEEVLNVSSLVEGQNIFRAGVHGARKRLLKLAVTADVSVTRVLPDTIVIRVVERVPRARVGGSRRFVADYWGVMLPVTCCKEPEKLPVVEGVETADLSVGDRCWQPEMVKAMRVLELCQSPRVLSVLEVGKVDCSNGDDIRLYLREGGYTREGCEVRVGGDGFEHKLANLVELLVPVVRERGKKIRSVDLTLNHVPVRF